MTIDTASHPAALTGLPAGTWTIDPSHSEVAFTVRHLMSKVRGVFETFEGTINIDNTTATAAAKIDLASVDTRDKARDEHLRSADFFDVDNNGPMTFTTTTVELGGNGLLVTGDLTIAGVTKPVTLDVEYLGQDTDPWGGTRIGFEATTSISRKEFGVTFNVPLDGGRVLVGDKVDITLAVQAVRA